ncbi:S1 RNA-binding domain-containing protein [Candidatus Woesearchaeota archaeon]|jgi:translation initiation factor 2 subunit 1|nr:S1 RNA-binding domain-containing protein [Candidatus Woesearchaeota archaeon]MBT4387798.1 S1 RNA-binding domain-containing protein [Candidatus Woesearchaeota archaeon]MBT4595617.1 S1 RNA-binding domain-containing protein [Candidatus Woesearchaeota archaeon]MBT5740900.1 S1 RNA-binding domain-containing protein [Candidatus Woesearchaeota archaeon]MBT7296175.1 S1 RNA-binding domain-containing protein [Candidatus Woesearchaeota archaeon]
MLIKREGLPDLSEIVICTVKSISNAIVFVNLDEYENKQGLIHISEISPGRIRNIRDYVKEGKKIVCKILTVNKEKNQIDLSLRRVNESARREKVDELKHEKIAESIIDSSAKELKLKTIELYKIIWKKINKNYDYFYPLFEETVVEGESKLEKLKIDENQIKVLCKYIKQRIKPPVIEIDGKYNIFSYRPNGAECIKEIFKKAIKKVKDDEVVFKYIGSGIYSFKVKAKTYQDGENIIKKFHPLFENEFNDDPMTTYSFDRQKKSNK